MALIRENFSGFQLIGQFDGVPAIDSQWNKKVPVGGSTRKT